MTPRSTYGEADKARKAMMVVGSNHAESVAGDTEMALKDFEDKLDKNEAENIKENITPLRDSSQHHGSARLMPFRPPRWLYSTRCTARVLSSWDSRRAAMVGRRSNCQLKRVGGAMAYFEHSKSFLLPILWLLELGS
jgi:hypothetical protein